MGNYFFTNPEGAEVKVEYSFGYVLDAEGKLRINLHHSSMPHEHAVTRDMVEAAQKEWGDGIVKIATAKENGEDFEQAAHDHITNLYAYGSGDVLFKPTLAAERQFRSSFEGALSYFVATNNYFFTNPEGAEVKVEYSFGYVLDAEGKLRINLHHSSMPHEHAVTTTPVN